VVAVAEACDPVRMLETILAEHGPLHDDDIAGRLRDTGVADPDPVLRALHLETECPATQLVDDRWVWLPTVLAGRVFTHRLGADEAAYDLLAVTPDQISTPPTRWNCSARPPTRAALKLEAYHFRRQSSKWNDCLQGEEQLWVRRVGSSPLSLRPRPVELLISSGKPIAEIARDLGISDGTLGNWMKTAKKRGDVKERPLEIDERARLKELEEENRRLKMEREILKKAAAWFAKESM
jgi:transposase-like protein